MPVAIAAITSCTNTSNPTVMVGAALGLFAYVAGRADFSTYLFMPHIPGAGELTVVCAAVAGAGLGFLWFNAYPAEIENLLGSHPAVKDVAASVIITDAVAISAIGGMAPMCTSPSWARRRSCCRGRSRTP